MRTRRNMLIAATIAGLAVAGCRGRAQPAAEPEAPTLNVTHWTERTELYLEYPPLVAGHSALFAVHLTTLADFKPVAAGQARIEFTPQGGQPSSLVGPKPSRPGAFRVEGAPPAAGQYRWALVLEAPGLTDRHDLGEIRIFADEATANAEAARRPAEDASAIAYLKEQQWTNEFATAPAQDAEVRTSLRVPAMLDPLPGGEAVVAAPAAGRLVATNLPGIGDRVRAGATLARLEPRLAAGTTDRATLAGEVSEAQVAVEAARAEHTRAERLLADRAVPARRVEDARRAATVAEARLKAAEARLAQRDETLRSGGGAAAGNAFVLRAPISGRIIEAEATPGASYDEGTPLFKIARTDALELKVFVPAADAPGVRNPTAVALELPGRADPLPLRFHHVHDPGALDPRTKALPVQMEVENPSGELLIGQTGTAIIYTGGRQRMIAVPKTAVLMEAGRPYVFVQVGGETFARRYLELGPRDGDIIGVRTGVKPGERVVTRGAYEVQLASAAKGLPAEGHVH
jgi:membrane fusion protein, heavy metal efflux system